MLCLAPRTWQRVASSPFVPGLGVASKHGRGTVGPHMVRLYGGWAGMAIAVCVLASAWTPSAAADSSPVVTARVDDCVGVDRVRFQRLLSLELGTSSHSAEAAAHGAANVSVTCVPDGVELRLDDAVTRKSMQRVVDLSRVSKSTRSRLLAVTVAEFVAASWIELQVEPAPLPPVRPALSDRIERDALRVARRRVRAAVLSSQPTWQIGAAFDVMLFSSAPRVMPGVEVNARHIATEALALEVSMLFTRADFPTGPPVRVSTLSGLARALYTGQLNDVELSGGLGARVGAFFLQGTAPPDASREPLSRSRVWGGPVVVAGATYRWGMSLRIAVNVELGWLTGGVAATDGGGKLLLDFSALWGRAALGAGWAF